MTDLSIGGGGAMAPSTEYDYAPSAVPLPTEALLGELDALVLRAEGATRARVAAELALAQKVADERRLLEREIPDLMDRCRILNCETTSGARVRLQREVRASLPGRGQVAREMAMQWLDAHGHGGVVKTQVVVALPRGSDDGAALAAELKKRGHDVEARTDVHHSTLSALIKELLAEGKVVPSELFHVFDQRVAKLSRRDP